MNINRSIILQVDESEKPLKMELDAECDSTMDLKLLPADISKRFSTQKEIDSIEALLKGFAPKSEPGSYLSETNFGQTSVDESPSTSQTKAIADDIDLNMTEKLFEGIPENLQRSITNALSDMSQSVDGWLSQE